MRRVHLPVLLLSFVLLASAFLTLADAQTPPAAPGAACQVGLTKHVDPDSLRLGDTVQVTMIMTHTCPPQTPPMDLMFLVDISNSMTKGEDARISDPCGPDPGNDPLPTKADPEQTPGTGEPPKPPTIPGITEPTECPTRPPVLPIIDPTRPSITDPTAGPTKDVEPPGTPDPRTPPVEPTRPSIIGPTRPSIIDPTRPREEPGNEDLIREAQQFLRSFVQEPAVRQAADEGRLRVALVAFESRSHTIASLTSKLSRISSGSSRLDSLPHGTTNVALGFYRANQIMDRGLDASQGANRVIVLLSDGKFDNRTIRGLRTREGIQHLAVAMGRQPDLSQLNNIVSERRFLLGQRDYQAFMDLYNGDLQLPRNVSLVRALVHDELAGNMRYVAGTAHPTATVTGQIIEWLLEPPGTPITMTYRVEPLEAGRWPVSQEAKVDWLDSIGRSGSGAFPEVSVDVIGPTPTATATHTPRPTETPTLTPVATDTPTPKPPPPDIYLPYVVREPAPKACVPSEQTVDVAIVIDTSDSMLDRTSAGRTKLAAAVEAGRTLADLLKLDAGGDQVTAIGFNSEAYVLTGLTADSTAVATALDALPSTQARGTDIAVALRAALDQMTGPARRPDNSAALVLLTDGRHVGQVEDVRAAAAAVKAAGVTIHTVGLGTDVDGALMAEVASDPSYYHYAPDGEGLREIYERIAEVIPCP